LRNISFDVEVGEVVGIVGPTGAGKTTLVKLLPRYTDPQSGEVLVDGVNVQSWTLHSLREQISVVQQEPLLFTGTIAANIRYGRLDATPQELVEAARAANAHDFIMQLPDRYQTTVGERGVGLSVGERQRICIARAFLKNAPILILDEPTSSVDSKAEALILDGMERLMEGRTTFMIAHRLSTLRRATKILVVDDGEIVEEGTHAELLRAGGYYRQLWELQSGRDYDREVILSESSQRRVERPMGSQNGSKLSGRLDIAGLTEADINYVGWGGSGPVDATQPRGNGDSVERHVESLESDEEGVASVNRALRETSGSFEDENLEGDPIPYGKPS
jgi:ABC-type multidrug transport system ATPase subunit